MRRRSLFRASNPAMMVVQKSATERGTTAVSRENDATYGGVISKTSALLVTMLAAGFAVAASMLQTGEIVIDWRLILGIILLSFVSVFVVYTKPHLAPLFSFVYAVAQGAYVGMLSLMFSAYFGNNIVPMALIATAGVVLAMLFLFRSGLIKVGSFFRRLMYTLVFSYLLVLIAFLFMSFFAPGFFTGVGMSLYLGIAVFGVLLASLFLLIDYDNIQQAVQSGIDKKYEWMLSLSLVITIVWLYIEMLRIIAILSSRNN